MNSIQFPGESPAYREARPDDYVFHGPHPDGLVGAVRLSELFAPGKPSLLWNMFDLIPEGRGHNWEEQHAYACCDAASQEGGPA